MSRRRESSKKRRRRRRSKRNSGHQATLGTVIPGTNHPAISEEDPRGSELCMNSLGVP